MMSNQTTLSEYLRSLINEYLKKKSHSLITLADKSGIHYNTLARILKGRVESPSLETALGILKVCESGEAAFSALRTYFPDYEVILSMSKSSFNMEATTNPVITEDLLTFRLLAHARSKEGVSPEWVKERYGSCGLDFLESLLSKGLLKKVQGKFFLDPQSAAGDLKSSSEFISAFCRNLKHSQLEQDSFLVWNLVDNFNEKGLAALKSASMDFFHEVEAIRSNPHFHGPHLALVAGLLGKIP